MIWAQVAHQAGIELVDGIHEVIIPVAVAVMSASAAIVVAVLAR